jgi:transposase
MQVTTIGLDIAKRVFQVHGVDASAAAVIRKKLRRSELLQFFARLAPCVIGIEACSGGNWRQTRIPNWRAAVDENGHSFAVAL